MKQEELTRQIIGAAQAVLYELKMNHGAHGIHEGRRGRPAPAAVVLPIRVLRVARGPFHHAGEL
jgi:hypothetical protein